MKITSLLILLSAVLFAGCKSNSSLPESPTEVLKRYIEASQKQDTATMKSLLSKGSLELIEKSAKLQNTTVDGILQREASMRRENIEYKLETRSEKIEGETASVEIKNERNGEFDMTMPFVRENGAWKLARDKFIEAELKKSSDEINQKLANSAASNSNPAVNSNENKP